jgi:hypothetical protein
MGVGGQVVFPPKKVAEIAQLTFDFTSTFEDITSAINAAVVSVSVWSGTDANPSALLSGAAAIVTPSNGTPARRVTQNVTGGLAGVIYQIECQATTASGLVAVQSGLLAIRPAVT